MTVNMIIIGLIGAVLSFCIFKNKLVKIIVCIICLSIGFTSSFYISVPDVRNRTYSDASSTLQAAGFRIETNIDTPADDQLVVSQSPEGGHYQWKHATIHLYFESSGPEGTASPAAFFPNSSAAPSGQVEVPNVVGLSIYEAASALCAAGLSPTSDIDLFSDPESSTPRYYASAQSIAAGNFVSRGTEVHLSHSDSAPIAAGSFSSFFQELTNRAYAQPQYSNEEMNQFSTWFYYWPSVSIMNLNMGSQPDTSSFAPEGLVPVTLQFSDPNTPVNLFIVHNFASANHLSHMSFFRTGAEVYSLLALGDYSFTDADGNYVGSVSVTGPGTYPVT